jgi:RND family efflux transporter MFP subunit
VRLRSFLLPTALVLLAPIALFAMRASDVPTPAAEVSVASLSDSGVVEASTRQNEPALLGVLLPREAVDVSAREVATVIAVNVRIGERVRKGDVLVSLDARLAASDLTSARAAAESQEVEVQLAAATSAAMIEHEARVLALAKEGLASVEQVAEAARDRKLTALRVEGARAALAEKSAQVVRLRHEKELKDVRAPFDGTVVARYVDPGATVTATPPKPLVRIIGADDVFVRFAVPEERLAALRVGERVRIRPRGTSAALLGTIERIAPEIDLGARIGFAEASIDDAADALVSGLAADVTLGAD